MSFSVCPVSLPISQNRSKLSKKRNPLSCIHCWALSLPSGSRVTLELVGLALAKWGSSCKWMSMFCPDVIMRHLQLFYVQILMRLDLIANQQYSLFTHASNTANITLNEAYTNPSLLRFMCPSHYGGLKHKHSLTILQNRAKNKKPHWNINMSTKQLWLFTSVHVCVSVYVCVCVCTPQREPQGDQNQREPTEGE